jgi:hypothetical protein
MRASVGGSTSERAARRAWYRGSSGSGAVVLGGSLAARGRCRLRAADEDGERLETSEPRQSEGVTWEGAPVFSGDADGRCWPSIEYD